MAGLYWRAIMPSSRREFLKMASAAPAAGLGQAAPRPRIATVRDSSFDPWVEVDTARLRHNAAQIARRAQRPILAVIKNNGYGAGVANVARVLEPLPSIAGFAVVKLHEAFTLRDAGVTKPVMLMGPFAPSELFDVVSRRIMPMVYTPLGDDLDHVSARLRRPIPIQICVDTGIGRVGVPHRIAGLMIRDLAARKSVEIAGLMMTFTEDPDFDPEQLRRFETLTHDLLAAGVKPGRRHAASSFGLFEHPEAFLDMVRPGMALYGIYSDEKFRKTNVLDLQPAIALKARVAYVKQLERGDSAGYERAYRTDRPVWIATLPVGHADGLPRNVAKGGRVRIGDALYPVVASVSASHAIVEVGKEPTVAIGDVATIFDARDGSRPEDLAASCASSVYDLTMHLHADLPRRVV
jgi:alanine racemase